MKDRKFIYLSIVVSLLAFMLITTVIFLQSGPEQVQTLPSPEPFKEKQPGKIDQLEPPAQGQTYQTTTNEDQKQLIRDTALADLLSVLPYKGQFFSLDFSYSDNYFKLTYTPSDKKLAEDEFNVFLRSKGIEKEWIDQLETNGELLEGDTLEHGGK